LKVCPGGCHDIGWHWLFRLAVAERKSLGHLQVKVMDTESLEETGFGEVTVREIEAPLRLASARECVQWRREPSGTMRQMLAGMGETAKTEIWSEIEQALQRFETPDGFESPCRLLVCSGVVRRS
jgi:transcription initiation factor IIE alpha subunit